MYVYFSIQAVHVVLNERQISACPSAKFDISFELQKEFHGETAYGDLLNTISGMRICYVEERTTLLRKLSQIVIPGYIQT
jgi:hypothetical protein